MTSALNASHSHAFCWKDVPMTDSAADSGLPPAIVEAVKVSMDQSYSAFFSQKPSLAPAGQRRHAGPCIAGIISFVGDVSWSFTWILTRATAPILARRFAGFEIPFDSPDMGDVAGELVNVFGGKILAELEKKSIKAQLSLPTVARGGSLRFVPEDGPSIVHLDYLSSEGPFSFRLAAAIHRLARLPGQSNKR